MNVNSYIRAATLAIVCVTIGYGVGRQEAAGVVGQTAPAAAARDSYQFFDTLVDLRSQIVRNYVEKVDDEKLMKGAIKGMMAELDPYSNYFTKEEWAAFDRSVRGQFSGIGAEISQDTATGAFVIVSPLDDSPALKAGVYAGDRVVKVNGESTEGWSLKELLTKMGGEPNTQIKLTVVHEGETVPVELTVTRAVVQIHSVRGFKHLEGGEGGGGGWDYLIDPGNRIAYVRLSSFMETTAEELDKALVPLLQGKEGLKGIILDLRFNPGGQLQAGIDVCKRFLDSGVIVTAGRPDTAKRSFVAEATKDKTYPHVPLVVLINEYSASASEIVAGALKDHHRGVLIGARTFGKGSVQTLINLDNGNAALKLTTQYYYLPLGKNVTRKKDAKEWGVDPDAAFNIPLTEEENRAVLTARSQSEIIHKAPGGSAVPVAGKGAASGAATGPATTSAPANPLASATEVGANGEPADRQLQRALEILIAYQAFGPAKAAGGGDVTMTRPGASASVPATGPGLPQTEPGSQEAPDVPR